jgi:hypothetical protein
MASIWLIDQNSLPAPRTEFDLAVWSVEPAPAETQARSWAGWAETALLAGNIRHGQVAAFTAEPAPWLAWDVAIGTGKIWRWREHYLAWLAAADLRNPEIARALSLAGVELLVVSDSAVYASPYINPLWRAVQSEQIFGLQLGPEPQFFLPCEIDGDEDGVGALAHTSGGWAVMVDFDRLTEARRLQPLRRGLRSELYRQLAWWHQ